MTKLSKIKPGDFVRFLNEKQEGVVTDITGNLAYVSVEGDFSIPVQLNELVKVEQHFAAKKGIIPDEKSVQNVPSGIFLAFERITESQLQIQVHNTVCDVLQLAWYEHSSKVYTLKKYGEIRRNESLSMYKINLDDFAMWPEFVLQQNWIFSTIDEPPKCCVNRLSFSAKTFHSALKHCFFLNKQAYVFQIDDKTPPPNLEKLSEHHFDTAHTPAEIRLSKPDPVIDLHIEKLAPNEAFTLTEYQILQRQMDTVKSALEGAIVNNMSELIMIHGVGKHVLKSKIIKYATELTHVHVKCTPADPIKYGGGATKLEIS
jgi:hypothetical protein